MHVPSPIAIPLVRGEANRVEIPVHITSNLPWSVCVEDRENGRDRGHMVSSMSTEVLERPMTVGVVVEAMAALDRPTCIGLATAAGDALVVVVLEQEVGAEDRPGSYRIALIFRAVAGF